MRLQLVPVSTRLPSVFLIVALLALQEAGVNMTSLPFPSEIGFQTVPVGAKEGRLSEERTSVTLTLPAGPSVELELTSAEVLEHSKGQHRSSDSHPLSPNIVKITENARLSLTVNLCGPLLTIAGIFIETTCTIRLEYLGRIELNR
ncbi:MAG: hypothetical protein QF595_04005 [Dehalococcoidia bacterium]|nr:hypothetical protein [Dehalococcoidia bacterium]